MEGDSVVPANRAAEALADDRPPFGWGVATASYQVESGGVGAARVGATASPTPPNLHHRQIEGGAREGGRGPSIWDAFSP